MKAKLYKITIFFLSIPFLSLASINPVWNGKYTKEKKIKKEFKVSADALLKLDNTYGNLYITSWNQNRTVIEVHITTSSNSEEKAQRKLDEIDVEFQASNNMVSARTVFNKKGWNWNNTSISLEINYIVKVPLNNSVDLSNDYGGIFLDEINGTATINCNYGRMEIGKLNAESNTINFDYTTRATFEYIKNAIINADYSGFEIKNIGSLALNADYTNSNVGNVKDVAYSCDYGTLKIESIHNIKGSGDYLNTFLDIVHGNVNMESDYGAISIKEMASDAGNIIINSDYTRVKIGYNSAYHFDIEATLEYGDLEGDVDFEYLIKRKKSTESYYQGYYGRKGKNKIYIDSEYGDVSFYRR